ncbi:MAG: DUF4340 domain-containing protein [Chloroflexi bacterium]|nr:DUF4340 domain-containing protein [Chloroflexota bacterium]
MMRRPTWILLAILAALIGLAWYLNQSKPGAEPDVAAPTATVSAHYFFAPENGILTSIRIESATGEVVAVERGADGTWMVTEPRESEADQGAVEAASAQLSALRVALETIDAPLGVVGLQPASYTLTVAFSGGAPHTVLIGDGTPSGSGYYVQKDGGAISIVDKYGLDALLRLLASPPYAAEETAPTSTP